MSTVITLPAKELKDCFSAISLVAAKGSQLTPVSLILKDNKLSFVCLQGCIVQSTVQVASDEMANAVFMYYDVTPMISPSGNIDVALFDYGVEINGEDFSCTFPLGYSDVSNYDFSECSFTKIENSVYADGLRTVLGMNLDKLYGKSVPFNIYGNVSVVKHACCYVQFRTFGLPFTAQIDPEHVKMIIRFKPWEVSDTIPDTLVFRRKSHVLQIPCRSRIESNNFLDFLQGMKPICRVNTAGLYEKVNNASKVSTKSRCRIFVTEKGLKIKVTIENAESSVSIGDTSGDILFTTMFPIQTLLSFLRAISNDTMEILTGGELFCLRTQNLIILIRVEY